MQSGSFKNRGIPYIIPIESSQWTAHLNAALPANLWGRFLADPSETEASQRRETLESQQHNMGVESLFKSLYDAVLRKTRINLLMACINYLRGCFGPEVSTAWYVHPEETLNPE